MVNRANYRLTRAFLDHLRQVLQIGPASAGRYRAYLRHVLLWADQTPFAQAHLLRPTLPDYLAALASDTGSSRAPPPPRRRSSKPHAACSPGPS